MEHETSQDATQTALPVLKGANNEQVANGKEAGKRAEREASLNWQRGREQRGWREMLEDLCPTPHGVKELKEKRVLILYFILDFIHLLTLTRYRILE